MSASLYEKIDDGIAIYKPKKSRFWWCRIRVDNHPSLKEIRKSTKEEDRNRAIYKAQRIAIETEIKVEENIDIVAIKPTVADMAREAVKTIQNKKPFKPTYPGYIRLLEVDFIPYFTDQRPIKINELNREEIKAYFKAVKKKSQTQINMTKTCLKYIIEEGLKRRYIQERDVPPMPKVEKGSEENIRNHIEPSELKSILRERNFRAFLERQKRIDSFENKILMYAAVLFLFASGARPGEELNEIKGKDLKLIKRGEVDVLFVEIAGGKTGYKKRQAILELEAFEALNILFDYHRAKNISKDYIKNIAKRKGARTAIVKAIQSKFYNTYIFRKRDGRKVEWTHQFEQYIDFLKDRKEVEKSSEMSPYSIRHTYITLKLLYEKNLTIYDIAKQVGNSVQMIEKYYSKMEIVSKSTNFDFYKLEHERRKQAKSANLNIS